jgi:AraC-like DNA-binding protein
VTSEVEQDPAAELVQLIARHATTNGLQDTAVPDLHLFRSFTASEPIHTVYRPSLCLVAQGSKTVTLGTDVLTYGPAEFLLVSVNMPVAAQLLEASAEKPHLALHVDLDVGVIASLISAMSPEDGSGAAAEPGAGLTVGLLEGRVREAVLRLVRLLDEPRDIAVLAPMIKRELCYLLLNGPYGRIMRAMALSSGPTRRIASAIERLEMAFREPLRVEELAREVNMSVSGFHRHFKAVTALSPLQFQKRLRLQEARRMLIGGEVDVTEAGFLVGYESASQFSREYRQLFGSPPSQDIARLREDADLRLAGGP